MAETATTNPRASRSRTSATKTAASKPAASRTAAKPAAPKAAPAAPPAAEPTEVTRIKVELVHVGETKSYEKFGAPAGYEGVVTGNVYVPKGTKRVALLIVGKDDASED